MIDSMENLGRILIVEDETAILDGLTALFRQAGFAPDCAQDGQQALQCLSQTSYEIVVLDWMLPSLTGIEVLRELRARGDGTPVLMLTARGAEDDVVTALEAGADDYVTKPFGVRELVARARGLVRRAISQQDATTIAWGDITIDLGALTVLRDSTTVSLTPREAALLGHLAHAQPRVIDRAELLEKVWGYQDGSIRTRTVDVHIQQLRGKLKQVPGGGDLIQTVRGRGYRLGAAPS